MKLLKIIILFCLLQITVQSVAQDSLWTRDYHLNVYNKRDIRNSSYLGITTHQVLQDLFRKNVKPRMGTKAGNITYGMFSFATTYMTMIWSHEIGHTLRAKQVGGEFRIHDFGLPIPYTTMHLPADISYQDEALSVTGGFEVNYLTVRNIQRRFVENNGTFNEDISLAFANRLMYSIYTSIIVPIDPKDKEVWINTAGDPVHCILPVFKSYSNDNVFTADSSVNSELVNFYNQSVIFGNFFSLLDPQFYREFGASFGKNKTRRPIFLIGDHNNGWTYGTLFNVSPLGYELYMNNYIHLKGQKFSAYFKYGNPFKNNGLGLRWSNLLETPGVKLALEIEAWDQDIYGQGIGGELETYINLTNKFAVNMTMGYKTVGYVLGKQIDKGANLGFGLVYKGSY